MSKFNESFEKAMAAASPAASRNIIQRSLRKWNEALHRITYNRYDPHIPLGEIYKAAEDAGFQIKSEEDAPFALLGHDGKTDVEYVHPEAPKKTYYLHITWHRMTSGRFETVAYAN